MTTQGRGYERSSSGTGTAVAGGQRSGGIAPKITPTHEQIAARAKAIWETKGRPIGKDEENWREAEAQLRGISIRKS